MITKVISGGQTGADRAALDAAIAHGIPTLIQSPEGQNVADSDGTVWFGYPKSPGGQLTIGTAKNLGKPLLINPYEPDDFLRWIRADQVSVLNVAGNRLSESSPLIYEIVFKFLDEAFRRAKRMGLVREVTVD